jgi:hypothetical protein
VGADRVGEVAQPVGAVCEREIGMRGRASTEAWEVDEIHAVMAGKFGTLWRHHVVEAARPWTRTIGGPSPAAS